MSFAEFYNKTVRRPQKRSIQACLLAAAFVAAGCAAPKRVAIRDVCAEPNGATVATDGFVQLPRTVDTVQLTRGGRVEEVGYQVLLTSDESGAGDSVKVTLWATEMRQSNRIKAVTDLANIRDLTVYSNDGRELGIGNAVRITGVTVPDVVAGCTVTATRVDPVLAAGPEKAVR